MEEEEGEDIGGRRRGGGGGEDQWRRIHGGERERGRTRKVVGFSSQLLHLIHLKVWVF